MKILLDTCVWFGVRTNLLAAGYDVVWSGDWSEDSGDEEILATAYREGRILVTRRYWLWRVSDCTGKSSLWYFAAS